MKRKSSSGYTAICKLSKNENTTIYLGDEAIARSHYYSGTTWAPVGKTLIVETSGARTSVNMIPAHSSRGHLRFMFFNAKIDTEKFIDFLERLIYKASQLLFLATRLMERL